MAKLEKISYSQFAEDLLLAALLGKSGTPTYIDIGCLWPVKHSNTYLLYASGGRGLCIDANPGIADLYREARPRDIFVNAGVSSAPAVMRYSMFENPAFNTFDAKRRQQVLRKSRPGRQLVREIEVPVRPLSDILDEVGWWGEFDHLDALCMDVEGHELDVLEAAPLERLSPRVIVCEAIGTVEEVLASPVVRCLKDRGYRVAAATGHDCFFVRER